MNTITSSKPFDFAIFPVVPYDYLLWGRTAAFVNHLRKRGFFVNFFDIPPASPFLYFKDRITYHRGIINFLFPKPRFLANLRIFPQPPIFPASRFENTLFRRYNREQQYSRILKHYLPLIKREKLIAIVETPWWYDIIKKLNFSLLCYDCSDDLKVFCNEKQFAYFSILQRNLVEKADFVSITAQGLKTDIANIKPNTPVEYLPNGVDTDFFIKKGTHASTPLKLKNLSRPIVGFVGALYSWINIGLIVKLAKTYPNFSIVLVGPTKDIKLPHLPNIHHIGREPYSLIPDYINAFDVCIIPFIDDPLSDKVDPVKVYEYLSLGKPVVAINLPELERIKHLIYLTKDENEFISFTQQALQENNLKLKLERIQYARENSWSVRIDRLLEIVTSRLALKLKNFIV